jgi:hypothetical protein
MRPIFCLGNLEESDHLEDLYVDRRIILEIEWEGVYWTHLAQDRNQCRDVVKMVKNLRVP